MRLVAGLTSKTFNYLEANSASLQYDEGVAFYNFDYVHEEDLSSYEFLTNCVRISKPCAFINIAKEWKAVKENSKIEFNRNENKLNDENYKVKYNEPVP